MALLCVIHGAFSFQKYSRLHGGKLNLKGQKTWFVPLYRLWIGSQSSFQTAYNDKLCCDMRSKIKRMNCFFMLLLIYIYINILDSVQPFVVS